jgi:hypothetical protein
VSESPGGYGNFLIKLSNASYLDQTETKSISGTAIVFQPEISSDKNLPFKFTNGLLTTQPTSGHTHIKRFLDGIILHEKNHKFDCINRVAPECTLIKLYLQDYQNSASLEKANWGNSLKLIDTLEVWVTKGGRFLAKAAGMKSS